jgi:hypothetical protein
MADDLDESLKSLKLISLSAVTQGFFFGEMRSPNKTMQDASVDFSVTVLIISPIR